MGRTVTDNCYQNDDPSLLAQAGVATYPRSDAFCHLAPPWSSGTQVKFMAVYPLPWGIQTSAIYQNSSGIPITAQLVVPNAAVAPPLGRNLGSCRGAETCNGNVTVDLIPPTEVFEPRLQQLDLRLFANHPARWDAEAAGRPGYLQPVQRKQRHQHEHGLRFGLAGCSADSRRPPGEDRRAVRLLTGLDRRSWGVARSHFLRPVTS